MPWSICFWRSCSAASRMCKGTGLPTDVSSIVTSSRSVTVIGGPFIGFKMSSLNTSVKSSLHLPAYCSGMCTFLALHVALRTARSRASASVQPMMRSLLMLDETMACVSTVFPAGVSIRMSATPSAARGLSVTPLTGMALGVKGHPGDVNDIPGDDCGGLPVSSRARSVVHRSGLLEEEILTYDRGDGLVLGRPTS